VSLKRYMSTCEYLDFCYSLGRHKRQHIDSDTWPDAVPLKATAQTGKAVHYAAAYFCKSFALYMEGSVSLKSVIPISRLSGCTGNTYCQTDTDVTAQHSSADTRFRRGSLISCTIFIWSNNPPNSAAAVAATTGGQLNTSKPYTGDSYPRSNHK
jgi:hypothetical protein